MKPLILGLLITIVLFVYFARKKRPVKEMILYSVLSLAGITQLFLLSIEKPIRLPGLLAKIMDRLT